MCGCRQWIVGIDDTIFCGLWIQKRCVTINQTRCKDKVRETRLAFFCAHTGLSRTQSNLLLTFSYIYFFSLVRSSVSHSLFLLVFFRLCWTLRFLCWSFPFACNHFFYMHSTQIRSQYHLYVSYLFTMLKCFVHANHRISLGLKFSEICGLFTPLILFCVCECVCIVFIVCFLLSCFEMIFYDFYGGYKDKLSSSGMS